MMTPSINRNLLTYGVPLGLFALLAAIVHSTLYDQNAILPFAVSVDLVITVPVVYFLLIRKTTTPKTTVVPVMVLGLLLGTYLLPPEDQTYLALFRTWALPVVELGVLSYVVYTFRTVAKETRARNAPTVDFFTALKQACFKVLPKSAAMPFATEVAVFYYGFVYWKKRKLQDNEFTYHRNSGTVALLIVIIGIVEVETFVFHLLLARWSELAAWILTGLSVYSAIQLFGFLKSMTKLPISIDGNQLNLRYGIMNETTIRLDAIASMELSAREVAFDKETRRLSFLGPLEPHNVIIRLNRPHTLHGLYGTKKTCQTLALHVDDAARFNEQLEAARQRCQ